MDERTSDRLQDILDAADELAECLDGCTADAFATDRQKQRVAERLLEIAGEAATALAPHVAQAIPADGVRLKKMRILLAHGYHRVEVGPLWLAATQSLPALAKSIREAWARL